MNQLTCYIVGAGFMGGVHMECYTKLSGIKVLGIVDNNKERGIAFADKHKIRWNATLEDAFAIEKADFCDVCLPSYVHKDAVIKAFFLGANVICEKPFAVSLEDVDQMIAASTQYGKRLMIAHVCRFMPQYYVLKDILESKSLGRPITFETTRESETPAWTFNNWLKDKSKSGGTLLDLSVHDIDVSNWLFGIPNYHHLELSQIDNRPGADYIVSTLGYGSGVSVNITANHLLPKAHPFFTAFRLVCEKGCVEYNSEYDPENLVIFKDNECEKINLSCKDGFKDSYLYELEVFTNCLRSGSDFPISLKEARVAVETVIKLYAECHKSIVE